MLSKGYGVPEQTRQAYARVQDAVRQAAVDQAVEWSEQSLGLEGEKQLCIRVADPARRVELFARIEQLARGVELLHSQPGACQ